MYVGCKDIRDRKFEFVAKTQLFHSILREMLISISRTRKTSGINPIFILTLN